MKKKNKYKLTSAKARAVNYFALQGFLAIISAALIIDFLEATYTGVWPVTRFAITVVVATIFGVVYVITKRMTVVSPSES